MPSIPQGTEIPQSSGQFMKFQEGKNRLRVLSDIVTGFEGWRNNKPFRQEDQICKIKPEQVDLNQNGLPNINYFWAMVVWNYGEKKLQTLEITQKTIMKVLKDLEESSDWGDLKNYDIEIVKSKVGDKTTYTTLGIPPKKVAPEILKAYEETEIDLKKLFIGEYPMGTAVTAPSADEADEAEEIPF